jgi:hypothetical protein
VCMRSFIYFHLLGRSSYLDIFFCNVLATSIISQLLVILSLERGIGRCRLYIAYCRSNLSCNNAPTFRVRVSVAFFMTIPLRQYSSLLHRLNSLI